jgi:hypothetical protein
MLGQMLGQMTPGSTLTESSRSLGSPPMPTPQPSSPA